MKYNLFLFDLDDTLLDFGASEKLSFSMALQSMGFSGELGGLFQVYQGENRALWKQFELGQVSKEYLKVERFRRVFKTNQIDLSPEVASARFLEALPETVVLVDHAVEICEFLVSFGEIGIITNGINLVQTQRISKSKLAPYISFTSVSEECGFAKPDSRFFEHSVKKARSFSKSTSIVIGDRLEADIQGAIQFGLDSCWYNPAALRFEADLQPTYCISHLSEIENILKPDGFHSNKRNEFI